MAEADEGAHDRQPEQRAGPFPGLQVERDPDRDDGEHAEGSSQP
jgi:hypothetical protein